MFLRAAPLLTTFLMLTRHKSLDWEISSIIKHIGILFIEIERATTVQIRNKSVGLGFKEPALIVSTHW